MRIRRVTIGLLVALLPWTVCNPSWAKANESPEAIKRKAEAVFDKARQNMQEAEARHKAAAEEKLHACQVARTADEDLATAQRLNMPLGQRAAAAIAMNERCENADNALKRAIQLDRVTRGVWRAIALDLEQCGEPGELCEAQKQAEVVDLVAEIRESTRSGAAVDSKKLEKLDQALIDFAAGAQKRTAKQRAYAEAAYKVQDPLMARVLASKASDDNRLRGRDIREGSSEVIQAVPELRSAAQDAQVATNQLVLHAATLLVPCQQEAEQREREACLRRQATAREAAAAELASAQSHLAAAQKAQDRLRSGAAKADAGLTYSTKDERRVAIEFAGLLDRYPDARSMLGDQSAVGLSASGDGGLATFKLALGRALPAGLRSTTLILTSPIDNKGFTHLSNVDGLSRAVSLEIGMKDLQAISMSSSLNADVLRQSGMSVKFGVQPHSHLQSIEPKQEVTSNHKHWELSAFSAFYRLKATNPSVHVVKLQLQRTLSNETTETRCPVSATPPASGTVRCETAAFEPLTPEWRTLMSYQIRLQSDNFGFSPLVTYSARKERRWDVELPVYFIPGEGKDAPLSGGIKLNWTNKPGEGKPRARFGLFVGSTFDFWGAP